MTRCTVKFFMFCSINLAGSHQDIYQGGGAGNQNTQAIAKKKCKLKLYMYV